MSEERPPYKTAPCQLYDAGENDEDTELIRRSTRRELYEVSHALLAVAKALTTQAERLAELAKEMQA